MERRKVLHILAGILLAVIVFFIGVWAGYNERPEIEKVTNLLNKESEFNEREELDLEPLWKTWRILGEKFVPPNIASTTDIYNQELVWGAIQGLVASLDDPHSVFLPPVENETFQADISGEFTGVGMEITRRDGVITVVAPLKDTPAFKAGIKTNDRVIAIDGTSTEGFDVTEAVDLIRGPKGEKVTLRIAREETGEVLDIDIVRDVIRIPTVDTRVEEYEGQDFFVLELHSFNAQSIVHFRAALEEFVNSGTDKLILDLRGNPGGFLEAAVDIASWFLAEGKVVLRENFGNNQDEKIHRSLGYNIFTNKLKMAILVDGGSASASEIVAGALGEHGKAVIVGTQTFGKGSVQELVDITDDTSLKVTIARWLTPNGESISLKGLEPDVIVEITEEHIEAKEDPQLEEAMNLLLIRGNN